MPDTLTYMFEEIRLAGEGLLASGTAELQSSGEGYEGEFFVRSITFRKGPTLDPRHILQKSNMSWLFNLIASEIENSDDAQAEWAAFEAGATQDDLDNAYNERRAVQDRPDIYSSLQHSTMDARTQGLAR